MYDVLSKIFLTDAVKIIKTINACENCPRPPSYVQLSTDLLDMMVVLPYNGASYYHNYCIDGGASPEYFGYPWYVYCKVTSLRDHCCYGNAAIPSLCIVGVHVPLTTV
jgi:hypothetical protein